MGGASSIWYSKNKRKVLILSFEEDLTSNLGSCLLHKEVKVNEHVGFTCENFKFNQLEIRLWFLTSKNRHLWRHHYYGTQGVILVFSFKDPKKGEKLIIEALSLFSDKTLSQIPILVLFDNTVPHMEKLNEEFRNKINLLKKENINSQYINLESRIGEIGYGLDWLCEVMKPILG